LSYKNNKKIKTYQDYPYLGKTIFLYTTYQPLDLLGIFLSIIPWAGKKFFTQRLKKKQSKKNKT